MLWGKRKRIEVKNNKNTQFTMHIILTFSSFGSSLWLPFPIYFSSLSPIMPVNISITLLIAFSLFWISSYKNIRQKNTTMLHNRRFWCNHYTLCLLYKRPNYFIILHEDNDTDLRKLRGMFWRNYRSLQYLLNT